MRTWLLLRCVRRIGFRFTPTSRRRGHNANEAQDLTQEFFARLLEKDYVAEADPERGRFRAFLLTAFKHFLSKERDKARAQKRGGGRAPAFLGSRIGRVSIYVAGPADTLTPEQLYDRQWTVALLDRVMRRLEGEMRESGKADWFDRLKGFIVGGSDGATYAKSRGIARHHRSRRQNGHTPHEKTISRAAPT